MADLIDRQTAIDDIKAIYAYHDTVTEDRIIDHLKRLPSADAVEVVRCKDCKHYQFADNRAFGFPVKRCEWTGFEDVDNDDFCSRAERRTDG